ncbi:MAG: DUF1961 family protein [Planctomycetota bacterium]
MDGYKYGDEIYRNALASPGDIEGWRMEGDGAVSFPCGRLRMEGTRDPAEEQAANIVFWCPEHFPDRISVTWEFTPIREPGLCILFFAATGRNGEDVLDPALAPRTGRYEQYHHGDINALHVSYFRRRYPTERAFTTCNLRKSYGFHLVAQGADPIPSVPHAEPPYRVELVKDGPTVVFAIGQGEQPDCALFRWTDDGASTGPVLGGGRIGFRQMTPLIAEYANLTVRAVEPVS